MSPGTWRDSSRTRTATTGAGCGASWTRRTCGTAKLEGDVGLLMKLAATMVDFDPRFEILPGTKLTEAPPTEGDAFEVEVGASMAE